MQNIRLIFQVLALHVHLNIHNSFLSFQMQERRQEWKRLIMALLLIWTKLVLSHNSPLSQNTNTYSILCLLYNLVSLPRPPFILSLSRSLDHTLLGFCYKSRAIEGRSQEKASGQRDCTEPLVSKNISTRIISAQTVKNFIILSMMVTVTLSHEPINLVISLFHN